jgi:histidine triad (HIT) family protein
VTATEPVRALDAYDNDCVFCRIVTGEESASVVRHWPDALAIRPLNPVTVNHLLVLPKLHVPDIAADPWTSAMVMHRVADVIGYPRRLWDCNVITSVGAEATQTVFHLHVHIVPRRRGDGLALPWTGPRAGGD